MKPEPLTGKEGYVDSWQIRDKKDVHPSHITKVFEEEDIRSAVEWFEGLINASRLGRSEKNTIIAWLHQAFEDVMKDG